MMTFVIAFFSLTLLALVSAGCIQALMVFRKPKPAWTVVCAWCGKHINGPRIGTRPTKISHGICPNCARDQMQEVEESLVNETDWRKTA